MWQFRSTVVIGVLTAVLVFGAAVAYGSHSWWWNAQIDVAGVDVRTVWSVEDDEDGIDNYHADIRVVLPRGVEATVLEQADAEDVTLKWKKKLECDSDAAQARVRYIVTPLDGATGSLVEVAVTANGEVTGESSGAVGKKIKLDVEIPGACDDND